MNQRTVFDMGRGLAAESLTFEPLRLTEQEISYTIALRRIESDFRQVLASQIVFYVGGAGPSDIVADALCAYEGASPSEDQVSTLVDLARDGDEATFKELASLLGVESDRLDAMWTGTVARVKPRGVIPCLV